MASTVKETKNKEVKRQKAQPTLQKKTKIEVKLETDETSTPNEETGLIMPSTIVDTGTTEVSNVNSVLIDGITLSLDTSINSINPYPVRVGALKNMSFTDLSSLTNILSQNILKNNYDGGDTELKKLSNELIIKINDEIKERIKTWDW